MNLRFLFVAISILMATTFSYAQQCDMASCAKPASIDSGDAKICTRSTSDCECAALPSDCFSARRVSIPCTGELGWVLNHGKMLGQPNTICCGYKLPPNTSCDGIPDYERPPSYLAKEKKEPFVTYYSAWKGNDLFSFRGSRKEIAKAQLDICLAAHHVDSLAGATIYESWENCINACQNPKINKDCKSKLKNSRTTICTNSCNCLYEQVDCKPMN